MRLDSNEKRQNTEPNEEKFSYKNDLIIALIVICGLFGGLLTVILWANKAILGSIWG